MRKREIQAYRQRERERGRQTDRQRKEEGEGKSKRERHVEVTAGLQIGFDLAGCVFELQLFHATVYLFSALRLRAIVRVPIHHVRWENKIVKKKIEKTEEGN